MAKIKILYVSGTYCPSHGGAEISMHIFLKFFQKSYGDKVLVVTDKRFTKKRERYFYDTVELFGIQHDDRKVEIQQAINFFKPNLIITQLTWSDVVLEIANDSKIPSIIRICKVPFELNLRKESPYSPRGIWCVSKAVKKYVRKKWNRNALVLLPPIEFGKTIIVPPTNKAPIKRKYVTFFNPLIRKGGEIFKDTSKKMPDVNFATIYGWSCLKDNRNSKTFSDKYIQRITESEGSKYDGEKPSYVGLSGCSNISILKPTENVREIYAKTSLLIIPSQWEEAFGRVAIEAMANGIPVIGSNVGGLKEAIGKGGVLIKDYGNSNKWVEEINKFADPHYSSRISAMGKQWVSKNYSKDDLIKIAHNYCESISTKS